MSIFEKKFAMLLEAPVEVPTPDEIPAVAPVDPVDDTEITGDTLSVADDVGDNPAIGWRKEANSKQRTQIESWISRLEEFTTFLNGVDSNSMQAQLNQADCDTLFNGISRGETKKISRIAQDVSALVESLKGYLLSADDE